MILTLFTIAVVLGLTYVDNWSGVGDVVGDIDNGSPSPSLDNSFEFGWPTNIKPHEFAAVGNVGGCHAINNNHCDVAVVNNVGDNEIIHNSCVTGLDINVGDQIGVVDVLAALNSDPCDVAILQQQGTSSQQPEILGNTNINNENQKQGGDDSVNNATGQARETINLQQGLALAKLLDIMNSEQKTVWDWPVCQRSHTYESNLH